jgi:hypothetical protein
MECQCHRNQINQSHIPNNSSLNENKNTRTFLNHQLSHSKLTNIIPGATLIGQLHESTLFRKLVLVTV